MESPDDWVKAAAEIFEEATTADYWKGTWFRDTEPNSSFVGTLSQLSAEQASSKPACGRNTVVAHTRHVLAYMEMGLAYLCGEEPTVDWEETWSIQELSGPEWDTLRSRLQGACDEWRAKVAENRQWESEDSKKGLIAFVAHAAYHLGAIRQLAAAQVEH
jgi:hypothetical protein